MTQMVSHEYVECKLEYISLWDSHLDFPKHIFCVSFINLFTICKQPLKIRRVVLEMSTVGGAHFQIKLRLPSRHSKCILEQAV